MTTRENIGRLAGWSKKRTVFMTREVVIAGTAIIGGLLVLTGVEPILLALPMGAAASVVAVILCAAASRITSGRRKNV